MLSYYKYDEFMKNCIKEYNEDEYWSMYNRLRYIPPIKICYLSSVRLLCVYLLKYDEELFLEIIINHNHYFFKWPLSISDFDNTRTSCEAMGIIGLKKFLTLTKNIKQYIDIKYNLK